MPRRGGSRTVVRTAILALLAVLLLLATPLAANAAVWTDAYYYSFGDLVAISGDGMAPGEPVAVAIYAPGMGPLPIQYDLVAADADGLFADTFLLAAGSPVGIYTVVATGQDSGNAFTCEFDPPLSVTFELATTGTLRTGQLLSFSLSWDPPANAGTYGSVDWGDGTSDEFSLSGPPMTVTHRYSTSGTYKPTAYVDKKTGNAEKPDKGPEFTVYPNSAPTIDAIDGIAGQWGDELGFTAVGHDADAGETLSYSLSAGAPGAIDSASGAYAWTPESTDIGDRTFDVIVTDSSGATATAAVAVSVTKRQLTVQANGVNKVYDGSTDASATFDSDAPAGYDDLEFAYTATFASSRAGTGIAVSVTDITLSGGVDAGLYDLVNTASATTADITPLGVTGAFTADDKVYDGGTAATVLTRSVTGAIYDDDVSLVGGTAAFADKNVEDGKTVTLTGATLEGLDAGNYTLDGVDDTTANITPLGVTGSFTADNKIYDGGTAAVVLTRSVIGAIDGDDVSLAGGTAAFSDKNVEDGKTVTLTGATLEGADAGNYTLDGVDDTTANITPLGITATFTAEDKVYDRTKDVTITTPVLVDPVEGDDVALEYDYAYFCDSNAALNKDVRLWNFRLVGGDASNYIVEPDPIAYADITPKHITAVFTADDKVYDGMTQTFVLTCNLVGVIEPDGVWPVFNGEWGGANFSDKNAGTDKVVTYDGLPVLGGNGNDQYNYILDSIAQTTADITPRELGVDFTADDKVYDGTDSAVGHAELTGVISPDEVSLDGGTATFANKNVGDDKTVTLHDASLAGADAGNYTLPAPITTTASITPRDLTVKATGIDKVFDDTAVAEVTLSSDKLSGDEVGLHYEKAVFADKNAGEDIIISVVGISIDGADAPNYHLTDTSASTTASIDPVTTSLELTVPAAQYSDQSIFRAAVSPADVGDTEVDGKVQFYLEGEAVGSAVDVDGDGVATLSHKVLKSAGAYAVTAEFASDTGNFTDAKSGVKSLSVSAEDASVSFEAPSQALEQGKTSGVVDITGNVQQAEDGAPWQGDLAKAKVRVTLIAVGNAGNNQESDRPVDSEGNFSWSPNVAPDAYEVRVEVVGGYFTSPSSYDALAVYDPSLGFATGGGWLTAEGEKMSFGFVTKYGKNGNNPKGNLVVVRHEPDGSIYRLKSNALQALSLGTSSGYGWVSLIGKGVFAHVMPDGTSIGGGNYGFTLYAEDRNEPGNGTDVFSLKVAEPTGALSAAPLAAPSKLEIGGGNIVIPHK